MLASKISTIACSHPNQIAIKAPRKSISYQSLNQAIKKLALQLSKEPKHARLAIALDNSPAWLVLDIAAMSLGIPNIPLPSFFSDIQIKHAVNDSGATLLVTDNPTRFKALFASDFQNSKALDIDGDLLTVLYVNKSDFKQNKLPEATVKITYTSGTTGSPKGVCLSLAAMLAVADSIQSCVSITHQNNHLCVLPLTTLLENVAGVYSTLMAGGCVHVYPTKMIGFKGTGFDINQLYQALVNSQANTAILIPELLKALIQKIESNASTPKHLQFLAVGGAHLAPEILKRANALGLPVFEGYGLSESTSVATLNTPNANRIGSVGKPLPHIQIKLASDKEILIKGSNYLGYTHDNTEIDNEAFLYTGDIGYCDDDGYWYIQGRKKDIFITSFGRNVSPEWVESTLTQMPSITQACLFGEAKPFNTAVIVPAIGADDASIKADIEQANAKLPDYAQITKWVRANQAFELSNQQLTANGRLKRDMIWQSYQDKINAHY